MTNLYTFQSGQLHCEGVALNSIAASAGTPAYVYSAGMIRARYQAYDAAFGSAPHRVCYAVKANSNLAVLALLAKAGAGFDIVSGGELFRVLKAGGDPAKVVFSGVGKTAAEIRYALEQRIHSFNCESEAEIDLLDRVAGEMCQRAHIALRVNPDVNPVTHKYISTGLKSNKFGIDIAVVEAAYAYAASRPNLVVSGVSCHIGSQMLDYAPMVEAVEKIVALASRLRDKGMPIDHLDLGGGLGIPYEEGQAPPPVADTIAAMLAPLAGTGFEAVVEPGRSIVAEAGVLLTEVLLEKRNGSKDFVVIDAAMNDLIRPALYEAFHEITPLEEKPRASRVADFVGPVCESGDFIAKDRQMGEVSCGELLAIRNAGAYGFGMSSNYNSRGRAAEVLVEGSEWRVVRQRESWEDLIRGEQL
jgi:diaminopimelate decarboxylase